MKAKTWMSYISDCNACILLAHINNQYITLKDLFDKLTDIISYIKIKLSILSLNIIQWSEFLQLETWAICCGLRSQRLFSHIETYLRSAAVTIDCGLIPQGFLIYISWLRLCKRSLSHNVRKVYVNKINGHCSLLWPLSQKCIILEM